MSEKESEFLKNLKKTVAVSIGSSLVVLIGVLIGFYFTTTYKIGDHDKRLEEMEKEKVGIVKYEGHLKVQEVRDKNIAGTLERIEGDIGAIKIKINEL